MPKQQTMTIKNADAYFDEDCVHLILTVDNDHLDNLKQFLYDFPFDTYEMTIKKKRKPKRSLSINAYFWILLDQIAAMLRTTKEELYKEVVRTDGVFTITEMKSEAFPRFKEIWSKKGLGWCCEKLWEKNGRTEVACYYGSSVYDSVEMNRIVDRIVEDAKQCGIETATPQELDAMKKAWAEHVQEEENDSTKRNTSI